MSYRSIVKLIVPPSIRNQPQWRQIEELLLEKIKEHPLDQIRQHPYRGVRGYPDWSTVVEHWLKPILFIDTPLDPGMGPPDGVMADAIGVAAIFDAHQGPAYWMDRDFLELLRGATFPEFDPADIPRNVPAGVLVLPEGAIATPDGDNLLAIAFAHILPGESVGDFTLGGQKFIVLDELKDGYRLICLGITDGVYTYTNNLDLANPTKKFDDRGSVQCDSDDDALIEELGLITLKALMAIYSSSGVAQEQGARPTPTPGMSRRQQQRLVWEPAWIGKNYGTGEGRGGEGQRRKSPRMHFRRGHERRVPCGKRRLERKVVRIPFKIVMEGHDD